MSVKSRVVSSKISLKKAFTVISWHFKGSKITFTMATTEGDVERSENH